MLPGSSDRNVQAQELKTHPVFVLDIIYGFVPVRSGYKRHDTRTTEMRPFLVALLLMVPMCIAYTPTLGHILQERKCATRGHSGAVFPETCRGNVCLLYNPRPDTILEDFLFSDLSTHNHHTSDAIAHKIRSECGGKCVNPLLGITVRRNRALGGFS